MATRTKPNVAIRAFTVLFRRHDPERRPREAFWLWVGVGAIVLLGGVAGYAVPAALTWWRHRGG